MITEISSRWPKVSRDLAGVSVRDCGKDQEMGRDWWGEVEVIGISEGPLSLTPTFLQRDELYEIGGGEKRKSRDIGAVA